LPFRQCRRNIGSPVVFDPIGVYYFVDTKHFEALGHRVVVIIQPPLTTISRHAGIVVERIVLLDPLISLFDPRVVFGYTAINKTLDTRISHAAIAIESAVGSWLVAGLRLAASCRTVDKAAIVALASPGLIVVLTLVILATADEDHRSLIGLVVLG